MNCTTAYKEHPDICSNTREMNLRLADKPIDGFSALSVRVNLGNDRPELNNRLKALDWNKLLDVKIDDLRQGVDFEFRFEYFKG